MLGVLWPGAIVDDLEIKSPNRELVHIQSGGRDVPLGYSSGGGRPMSFKSFYIFLLLTSVFKKAYLACTRMQRRVNHSHTSLTKGTVKRPGLDY